MAGTALVVGSGVFGLRTALELLKRKINVCLLSPHPPLHPSTCSMGAGGLWMPFHCDDDRTDRWSFETLDEILKFVSEKNGSVDRPLVELLPAVSFRRDAKSKVPEWALGDSSKKLGFQYISMEALYEESKIRGFRLPKREIADKASYSHAWLFQTPIVDSPRMLTHMLDEIKSNQHTKLVNVETGKYYSNLDEMVDEAKILGCDILVNCTGLGSQKLCNDNSMIGARGVLMQYDRTSCIWDGHHEESDCVTDASLQDSVIMIESPPYGSETHPCYMIPRGDIIAVGGTYLEGDGETNVRSEERDKILKNARVMGIDTEKSRPIGNWVGYRPYRPSVRLEQDGNVGVSQGVKIVHNYGAGGSGWTIFYGAAKEAADLVESIVQY
ncbi:hypothetical protein ACHAXS_010393 [Conticribra weissflogii]